MREIIKLREVAGSAVITLPQIILEALGLELGDRLLVEAMPPRRIIITKEGATMQSTQRVELELDLLGKKRQAIESDLRYKDRQFKSNMPSDPGMDEPAIAILVMSSLERDRDRLEVEIAEKRLELHDLQGGEVPTPAAAAPSVNSTVRNTESPNTHVGQIFVAVVGLINGDLNKTFTRVQVRDFLRLSNRDWQSGYTAIFQGMRNDEPGGAPSVGREFSGVFHRVGKGRYELSDKGKLLARTFGA